MCLKNSLWIGYLVLLYPYFILFGLIQGSSNSLQNFAVKASIRCLACQTVNTDFRHFWCVVKSILPKGSIKGCM